MMARSRSITLCILLAGSSAALGGVEVVLSPTTAGPYSPGETVAVDVLLSQVPSGDPQLLRLVQLDLSASDAGLTIVLPTTHAAASLKFWDFITVPDCLADDADCGAGHFIDDELPGLFPPGPDVISITYVGDLTDPNNPDLNENFNRQWLLMGDGTAKKIGQLRITLPAGTLPSSCPLDVLNAGETDVAFGARVDFGFGEDGRTTWRASAGEITGDALDLCATTQVASNLLLDQSDPVCDGSLWRSAKNVARLHFDADLAAPPNPGDILIQLLLPGPAFDATDLSGSFTYTIENDTGGNPRILKIQETAAPSVLTHRSWYGIRNTGSWTSASNFQMNYIVLVGDADADRRVLSLDVLTINAGVPCFAGCGERLDIDGDGRILSLDVLIANANVPSFATPIPSGHTCSP